MPGRTSSPSDLRVSSTRLDRLSGGAAGGSGIRGRPSRRLGRAQWQSIAAALGLSDRQLEVIRCVFDGLDEASISRELDLSRHTVHTYLDRLYKKLHVNSRCELIVRVFVTHVSRRP